MSAHCLAFMTSFILAIQVAFLQSCSDSIYWLPSSLLGFTYNCLVKSQGHCIRVFVTPSKPDARLANMVDLGAC